MGECAVGSYRAKLGADTLTPNPAVSAKNLHNIWECGSARWPADAPVPAAQPSVHPAPPAPEIQLHIFNTIHSVPAPWPLG